MTDWKLYSNPVAATSSLQANPRGGYYYKMTYEVVTPESAAEGDAEERGWEVDRSENFSSLQALLRDVEDKGPWLEWSSSHPTGNDWIISQGDEDFRTGAETSYHLFIKRNDGQPLSRREIAYISDELGLSYR